VPRAARSPTRRSRGRRFFACLELEESQELFEARRGAARPLRADVSQATESLALAPKQVLFRQGDESTSGIYIVVAGSLGIYRQDEGADGAGEGPPRLTNILHEGESVGDVDVMDAARRSVSAIAQAEGCRLVVVSRALFLSFVAAHPRSLHTYLTQAIARLWRVAHFVLAEYLGLPRSAQERLPAAPTAEAGEAPVGSCHATDAAPLCATELRGLMEEHGEALRRCGRALALAPSAPLYAERAPGDAFYLLLEGGTAADAVPWPAGSGVAPTPLPAPALLGAASFLTRSARREAVRAGAGGAQLLAFGAEELECLLAASSGAFVALLLAAARALAPVIRSFISLGLNRVWLSAGDAAFSRGAAATSLYIIISGRVRLLADSPASSSRLSYSSLDSGDAGAADAFSGVAAGGADEVGRGDTIGEASLLAGGRHEATAICVRDTELVRMSRAAFELITARSPSAAARLLEAMARKLTRERDGGSVAGLAPLSLAPVTGAAEAAARRPPRCDLATLCILPAAARSTSGGSGEAEGEAAARLAALLASALGRLGPTLALDWAGAAAHFADGTVARLESPFYRSKFSAWLASQEETYAFIILLAEPGNSAWSRVCVSQADCVLVVARADAPPAPGPGEQSLLWRATGARRGGQNRVELCLLHEPATSPAAAASSLPAPRGTAAWLDARPLCRAHHHVRMGSEVDVARMARHLSGRAVGLLLAGGGGRGLVHLGALRALSDAGVPVDVVGGTGAGALLAAAFARGCSHRALLRACTGALGGPFGGACGRSLLGDITLPLLSVFSGWGLAQAIQEVLGATQIEDLWLRFFCTTTNLTRGTMMVHERGLAGRAVRAAQSLLGLLPPVTDPASGDLLADGGYLTSYPVEVMRGRFGVNTVIVVDCGSMEKDAVAALRCLAPLDGGVSGWRLVWERFARGGGAGSTPRYETLVAALLQAVQRRQLLQATREHPIDLHIRPSAPSRALLTPGEKEALMRFAYKQAFSAISTWQRREGAAWGGSGGGGAPPSVVLISAEAAGGAAIGAATQRWVSETNSRVPLAVPGSGGPLRPSPLSPPLPPPGALPALSPRFSGVPFEGAIPRPRSGEAPREAAAALLSRTASAEDAARSARGEGNGSPRGDGGGAHRRSFSEPEPERVRAESEDVVTPLPRRFT